MASVSCDLSFFPGCVCSDLKCSNILISNTNDVRLADFGLARSLDFSQYDDDEVRPLPF